MLKTDPSERLKAGEVVQKLEELMVSKEIFMITSKLTYNQDHFGKLENGNTKRATYCDLNAFIQIHHN